MLSSLFINSTILISFIFVVGQGLKASPKALESAKGKVAAGFFGGLLGIVLTLYSIEIYGETLVDLRFIPVVLLAYYARPISTGTAALIIAAFRIFFYGVNLSSVVGAAVIIMISLSCIQISKTKFKKTTVFAMMLISSLLIISTALIILLSRNGEYAWIIISYSLIYIFMGIVVYRLSEYIMHSNKLYTQFKEQAKKDFLTGLSNVRQFDIMLNKSFSRVNELGEKLSILAIDIDHFKRINDTYGHDGGDVVLKQLGDILKSCCGPSDFAARVGGEEFSVILLDCPHKQALAAAERIHKAVGSYNFDLPQGNTINISISVGAATYPDSIDKLEELKKQADMELYKAKETGRNKVCSRFIKECGN